MSLYFIFFVIILVLLFSFGVPISIAIFVSATIYFLLNGIDLSLIGSKVISTYYNSFILLAVPLFIFTAEVMNNGSVTRHIFNFSTALVGRLRGGTAHVNILASLIFSGMTGSAIADASGLGKMEIQQMKEEGYDDGFSCAITAASATIGPIFPPSIPMVIYAMLSGASIKRLFINGIAPGILLAIFLMFYVGYVAKRRRYPKGKSYTFGTFFKMAFRALPAILTPGILLGGIYTGIITPTEAGAVAGLYAILISMLVYKTISLKSLWHSISNTITNTGIVTIILGASSIISYIISIENIPSVIASWAVNFSSSPFIFLLILNIVLLILGMIIDTSVILVVFIPIILPIAQILGIDLVHLGLVITLNIMIGLSTPPFGMLLFVTSGISSTKLPKIVKEIYPIIVVMLFVLLIFTYIPLFISVIY